MTRRHRRGHRLRFLWSIPSCEIKGGQDRSWCLALLKLRGHAVDTFAVGRYRPRGLEDLVVGESGNRAIARRWHDDEGLSIVELLIALVVIMIIFAGLASTIIASFSSIRSTEARVRAVALANELVEEMATIPWNQLGMVEDELDADFLAQFTGDEALEFDGELLVLLGDEADVISNHTDSIDRDGIDYDITRWVTWTEEDDRPELKRMIVFVEWTVGGREFLIRSDGLRAPDPDELLDLEVSVIITSNYVNPAGDPVPSAVPLSEDPYENDSAFVITATLGEAPASVELRFRDRGGVLRTGPAPDTPEGETVREWTIAKGTYAFRHGRTAFTVFAEGDGGQIASNTATMRFYQDLQVLEPLITQNGSVVYDNGSAVDAVQVDEEGAICDPLTVVVDVEGMTPAEATPQPIDDPDDPDATEGGLTFEGPGMEEPLVMVLLESTVFGGTFTLEVEDLTVAQQLVDDILGDLFPPHTAELTIVADRVAVEDFDDVDELPIVVEVEVLEGCNA